MLFRSRPAHTIYASIPVPQTRGRARYLLRSYLLITLPMAILPHTALLMVLPMIIHLLMLHLMRLPTVLPMDTPLLMVPLMAVPTVLPMVVPIVPLTDILPPMALLMVVPIAVHMVLPMHIRVLMVPLTQRLSAYIIIRLPTADRKSVV